jgi:hypothetical protein
LLFLAICKIAYGHARGDKPALDPKQTCVKNNSLWRTDVMRIVEVRERRRIRLVLVHRTESS